jgi:uncharacterized spore protein YtfJ
VTTQEGEMNANDVLTKVRDAMNVRTAIGEPVVQDGVVILPAAKIRGGAGGGIGSEDADSGAGGGFGVSSTPVGAFVIKDGKVSWRPAIDVNKVIMGGQLVAIVALLTIRTIVKSRRKH